MAGDDTGRPVVVTNEAVLRREIENWLLTPSQPRRSYQDIIIATVMVGLLIPITLGDSLRLRGTVNNRIRKPQGVKCRSNELSDRDRVRVNN